MTLDLVMTDSYITDFLYLNDEDIPFPIHYIPLDGCGISSWDHSLLRSPLLINPSPGNGFCDVCQQLGGGGEMVPQAYLEF